MVSEVNKNDNLIAELLRDPMFEARPDGTIWRRLRLSSSWRRVGFQLRGPKDYYRVRYHKASLAIHRVVYLKYVGRLDPAMMINHKDGDKTNNRPGNLELCDNSHNQRHRFAVLKHTGVKGRAKLTRATVAEIRREYAAGETQARLADRHGVDQSTISCLVNFKTWSDEAA